MPERPTGRRADLACAALLTVLVVGPLLFERGFALVGDMVFVPHQSWKPGWLGLDGSTPRAVPMDAIVSVLTYVVPGDLLQKVLLGGVVLVAALGMARLVSGYPVLARTAAAVAFVWNPYVYERLAIGQWSALGSYACLPWVVVAAARTRDSTRRGWPGLAVALGAAAVMSASGGLMAAALACVVVSWGPRPARALAVTGSLSLLVNLPWLLPGLLVSGHLPVDPAGFDIFAARHDGPLGRIALVALGGIWKTSVAPDESASLLLASVSVGFALAATWAFLSAVPRNGRTAGAVGAVGLASLAFVVLSTTTPAQHLLASAARAVPGIGVLRDSDRYLAPWALVVAWGAAELVRRVETTASSRLPALRAASATVVLLPVLVLPSLAWGELGRLDPVRYPGEWLAVRGALARTDDRGAVAVLPWAGGYRRFSWNHERAGLDPAPRFFPGDVLIDDEILVGEDRIAREDARSNTVALALSSTRPRAELRAAGVRFLLVERDTPGAPVLGLPGRVVHSGPQLTLLDLGVVVPRERVAGGAFWVLAGDALAGLTLLIGACTVVRRHLCSGGTVDQGVRGGKP